MHRAWQETLPGKAGGEGLKRVVSSLGRYNWINKGKMVASGRAELYGNICAKSVSIKRPSCTSVVRMVAS
jgi:hypothetical protein